MRRNPSRRLLVAAGLVLAVILLSGALTRFTLARGLRIELDFADRVDSALRIQDRTPNPLGGQALGWFVSVTTGLGIVLFIVGVLRRESRLSTIAAAVAGIAVGFLLIAIFRNPPPIELDTEGQGFAEGSGDAISMEEPLAPEDAVSEYAGRREVPWVWTVLVAIPALAGIVLVLRPYLRRPDWRAARELGEVADAAADAIEAGDDLPDVIQRCYRDMVVAIERSRAVRRRQAMTPREFSARLEREGVPVDDVNGLTRLFELSRYGPDATTQDDERHAVEHLRGIARALGVGA